MQEELQHPCPVAGEMAFKCADIVEATLPQIPALQFIWQSLLFQQFGMDAHNEVFFVIGAVEYPDARALRQPVWSPPEEIMVQFFRAALLERVDLGPLRVETRHDVLDHAIFAGSIHRL